jgi:hypothetical protein
MVSSFLGSYIANLSSNGEKIKKEIKALFANSMSAELGLHEVPG